jgi:hypothetical protein
MVLKTQQEFLERVESPADPIKEVADTSRTFNTGGQARCCIIEVSSQVCKELPRLKLPAKRRIARFANRAHRLLKTAGLTYPYRGLSPEGWPPSHLAVRDLRHCGASPPNNGRESNNIRGESDSRRQAMDCSDRGLPRSLRGKPRAWADWHVFEEWDLQKFVKQFVDSS